MASGSKKVIYAAIGANFAIAVAKFMAAGATGSSAMISEGIHSLVDTGNGGLLLFGIKRSQQPPDQAHPFGHGKALYFWTLVVAILIFAVGGGISLYEGVQHLLHPQPLQDPTWNYAVLAFATAFEAYALTIAYKEFKAVKRYKSIWRSIKVSKDPTTFTVLFEDAAALFGLLAAFLGIFLAHLLDNPYLDGAASVVIGLILAGVAVFLAYESKGLLVGEGADPETLQKIRDLVEQEADIERLDAPMTMYFGPETVLLTLNIQFRKGMSGAEIEDAVNRIENTVRRQYPEIKHIFLEARSVKSAVRNQEPTRAS